MKITKWPKATEWDFVGVFEVWLTGSRVKGTHYG